MHRFDTSIRACAAVDQLCGIALILAPFMVDGESSFEWWSATLVGTALVLLAASSMGSLEQGRPFSRAAPYPVGAVVGAWLVLVPVVVRSRSPYFEVSALAGVVVLGVAAFQSVLALRLSRAQRSPAPSEAAAPSENP